MRFDIDFFEFSFLVEACIPPVPIARMSFWYDTIDKYYNVLTENERGRLFQWIQFNPEFDIKNEECLVWYNRYNPDNQYQIETTDNQIFVCFLHDDKYHTKRNTSINPDFIKKIKKI